MPVTLYPSAVKKRNQDGTYTDLATGVIDTIDSALSTTSTNPVENKAIAARVGTAALLTTAQNLTGAINEHVADIARIRNVAGNYNNAGFHNSLFRGKNLGTSVTADQYAAISAGTFEDLFIGDYWVIGGKNWRIAAFDYWLRCGDTECTTHHAVIVPDTNLGSNAPMNKTNITTGAYIGSDFYTGNNDNVGKATAVGMIEEAFGSSHILTHREYFANSTTGGYQNAGAWYDSAVDLMNEQMVYGCRVFSNVVHGTNIPNAYTIDKGQLPLFKLAPQYICNRAVWWLRDVVSASDFAYVNNHGACDYNSASGSWIGVRPAFGIKA